MTGSTCSVAKSQNLVLGSTYIYSFPFSVSVHRINSLVIHRIYGLQSKVVVSIITINLEVVNVSSVMPKQVVLISLATRSTPQNTSARNSTRRAILASI